MVLVADVPLVRSFGAGSVGFGELITFWGVGTAAGSIAGRRLTAATEIPALAWGLIVIGLTGVAIWLSPWFWLVLAATVPMGVGDAIGDVATRGLQQRRTPDELRSRVSAASDGVIYMAFAVALVLGGFALDALGPKPVYALGGLSSVLGMLLLLPVLRTPPVDREAGETLAMEPGPLIAARTPLTSPGDPPTPAPR
jgi:predicted MFS family arabinose efflux permease